jgi:hypothetical protein
VRLLGGVALVEPQRPLYSLCRLDVPSHFDRKEITVNIPGFAAEASLYKSRQVYRGYGGGGDTAPRVVAAQLSCSDSCALQYTLCLVGAVSGGPLVTALCFANFARCESTCPGSGGGGGGFQNRPNCNCPVGTTCCGPCVKRGQIRSCEGTCIDRGQVCEPGS